MSMGEDNEQDANWYSDDVATFGDRLSGAREASGLDQRELARRLGVKLKTLKAWENDLSEPRANRLQMLSGILGVSLGWLLTGRGEGIAEPGAVELDPALRDILIELRTLKNEAEQTAKRLGRLEKSLRRQIDEGAA